jgi:hypothetical protein
MVASSSESGTAYERTFSAAVRRGRLQGREEGLVGRRLDEDGEVGTTAFGNSILTGFLETKRFAGSFLEM